MKILLDTNVIILAGQDFEDNIVIACAERENVDAIITRNHKDFHHSSISVYTPSDWLAFVV
jgi:predicted nuclease of predicted toxin-antitoxin system